VLGGLDRGWEGNGVGDLYVDSRLCKGTGKREGREGSG